MYHYVLQSNPLSWPKFLHINKTTQMNYEGITVYGGIVNYEYTTAIYAT